MKEYKTILEEIEEISQLAAHNEGAGYEIELDALEAQLGLLYKKAVWASPHRPNEDQIKDLEAKQGYVIRFLSDLNPDLFKEITQLSLDSNRRELADKLLKLECDAIIQPGGDPAFQFELGVGVYERHIQGGRSPIVMHAFSKRMSKDIPQKDGSVKKVSTFKFEDWV